MVRQWFIGKGSIRRLIERSPVFPRVGGTRLIEFTGAVIVSTLVAGVREIEFSISQRRGSLFTTTRVDGFFSLSSVYVLSRSRVSVVVSLATRVEVGGSSFVILRLRASEVYDSVYGGKSFMSPVGVAPVDKLLHGGPADHGSGKEPGE
ncbi:hypothetical protein F2Q68_00035904 [Brassica cretica]|uniref:Uncharacterized protein n=1 Tax=Brassica cretica TaxID=69181 RepID=A0A8S9HBH5_BRACR|nr:hypothetical protein F2Q68_00035904 [Brassica cretica]